MERKQWTQKHHRRQIENRLRGEVAHVAQELDREDIQTPDHQQQEHIQPDELRKGPLRENLPPVDRRPGFTRPAAGWRIWHALQKAEADHSADPTDQKRPGKLRRGGILAHHSPVGRQGKDPADVGEKLVPGEKARPALFGNQLRNPRPPRRRRNPAEDIERDENRQQRAPLRGRIKEREQRQQGDEEDENRPQQPADKERGPILGDVQKARRRKLKHRPQRRQRRDDSEEERGGVQGIRQQDDRRSHRGLGGHGIEKIEPMRIRLAAAETAFHLHGIKRAVATRVTQAVHPTYRCRMQPPLTKHRQDSPRAPLRRRRPAIAKAASPTPTNAVVDASGTATT